MEEGYERVYSCFTCGTRHPKPTGKKCQVSRTKPASTVDLSDFMKEIRSLMATSSARMDKVEDKLDSLAVKNDVSTGKNKNKSQYSPIQPEVDSDQCSEDEEVNQDDMQINNSASEMKVLESGNEEEFDVDVSMSKRATKRISVQKKDVAALPRRRVQSEVTNQATRNANINEELTVTALRNNAAIVNKAAERLAQLDLNDFDLPDHVAATSANRGKKSGCVTKSSDKIKTVMDWPHFHVTRGVNAVPASYDELSLEEFILGYVRMLRDADCAFDKEVMWEFLEDLMEDAIDFSWQNAKGFFKSTALEVEHGKLRWDDSMRMQKRRMIQCRVQKQPVKPQQQEKKATRQPSPGSMCCALYQSGQCDKRFDHFPYIHACANCFNNRNLVFKHKEADCFFKIKESPKN